MAQHREATGNAKSGNGAAERSDGDAILDNDDPAFIIAADARLCPSIRC